MISFKLILGFLFALLVTAIMVLGIVSYQYSEDSVSTSFWVNHTHEVIDKAEELSSLYKDMQLESNAFFINGDSSSITVYKNARHLILSNINDLRNLVKDDPDQQAKMDSLEALLKAMMTFTDSVLIASGKQDVNKALLKRIGDNTIFRAKIRHIVDNIKSNELGLLATRQKANHESIASFKRTFFLLLAGIALLLVATFFSIRYNFNKRIRAQEELKNVSELFEKLFYDSPIGVVISEQDTGVILNCNKVYAELINCTKEELIGKTATMLGILSSKQQRNEIIRDAQQKGLAKDIEVYLKPKDKDPVWVSISMQSISINEKKCFLSAIVDLTTHKRAEEEIKKALASEVELNKMKSNFVTLASHEFRTPLTTILSSAFLLEKYAFGEQKDKVAKHLSRIKSSVNSLTSILDEFLSITKIEEGNVRPNIEQLDLPEYVENACKNLQTFAKPGQNIIYQHKGEQKVYTDPVMLGNIINNLVTNAIKYSPENSPIFVTSSLNSKMHLSVKDSGIGIPEEDQKHLFKRFYRGSNAGAIQGTGLGLHIMKNHVDMLNGSIKLNSQLGKGTEFEIIFDLNSNGKSEA